MDHHLHIPSARGYTNTNSSSNRDYMFITPSVVSDYGESHLLGVKRVDITFVKKEIKREGPARKIFRQRVKPINEETLSENRAMGSESDGFDFCDEAIEKVAKANSVKLDTTQILPEVAASPCAFHTKADRSKTELQNLYMTNHHAGHLPQKRIKQKQRINNSLNTRSRVPKIPTHTDIGQLEKDLDKYPKFPSALPGHMPSKEFVMTWLLHGSEPDHHFPELTTPRNNKKKHKQHKLGAIRNSFISE